MLVPQTTHLSTTRVLESAYRECSRKPSVGFVRLSRYVIFDVISYTIPEYYDVYNPRYPKFIYFSTYLSSCISLWKSIYSCIYINEIHGYNLIYEQQDPLARYPAQNVTRRTKICKVYWGRGWNTKKKITHRSSNIWTNRFRGTY